jgi:hypothetical protein
MKKNVILKILINFLLAIFSIMLIYLLVQNVKQINWLYSIHIKDAKFSAKVQLLYPAYIYVILSIGQIAINILFFINLNIKEFPFLKQLVFKTCAENKERIKEEKKEKKQAKLQAEIAEKQALLDKLNKE